MGWCLMMTTYFSVYDLLEKTSVPVSVGGYDFIAQNWDNGYFIATGSLANLDAITPGDKITLGTTHIKCIRATNVCTVTTASVWDGQLSLDVSDFDITEWSNRFIYFSNDSGVCAEQYYTIDRVAESFSYLDKRKDKIPDYALNSPFKPCEPVKTMHVVLKHGFAVYWDRLKSFERENDAYFHSALVLMNIGYAAFVFFLWRRRKVSRYSGATQL